jgi:Domain of Unknown Function (DUF1080)
MRAILYFLSAFLVIGNVAFGQQGDPKATEVWEPIPKIVEPGKSKDLPPSDAISLLNGRDLSGWLGENNQPARWKWEDNAMTVVPGSGTIHSERKFGNCQLHIEWRSPQMVKGEGQGRGNSGIFFMGQYELQVLDSYNNRTYSNGQAGSIYKQHIPLVNASKQPGEWQTYDVIFTAPRFNTDGSLIAPARITVFHNGVLIQHNVEIKGPTAYIGKPPYAKHAEKESLSLQDHGDLVSYRNIWIREL